MKIKVQGMSCSHCKRAVKESLLKEDNITSVEVDLSSGEVMIQGENLDLETIKGIVTDTGYSVE